MFVVNPIAGAKDKESTIASIKKWAQSSAIDLHILETTGKDDHRKVTEKVNEINPDKVVSVGGDGTLVLCANILRDHKTPLGVIPMGSANGMATELQIPSGIEAGLRIISKGKTKDIDTLEFEGHDYGIHISDVGLNARLVKHFAESGRRGFLGYAEGIFEEYIRPEYFEATVIANGKEITRRCLMVAFANAKRYGTGAMLNHKGKVDDGLLEICILQKLDLTDMMEHWINLVDESSSHIEVIQCEEAEIRLNRKTDFQIDGEVMPPTEVVKVKVIPRGLRVIVP